MSHSLFALASARALLDVELGAIAPQLSGLYGQQGLFVRPHANAPKVVSAPMLGRLIRLHVDGPRHLAGDAACAVESLPFADDGFRLVLVQHAAEVVRDPLALQDEIARVLAPEGTAIVVGFARWTPWRGWLAAQQSRGEAALHLQSAGEWRRALARHGVDTYAVKRVGPAWPRADMPLDRLDLHAGGWQRSLDPLRASFVLLARKRRRAATPLRRRTARDVALAPRFAAGSAHRACA